MLLFRVKVKGHSMEPALKHNQIVVASSLPYFFGKPQAGDIVVLSHGKCIIKRIINVKENEIFVVGDNDKESTDSRNFGWLNKRKIIGKVIYKI
jgi:nickel-type superoxide dismutase maturation protease